MLLIFFTILRHQNKLNYLIMSEIQQKGHPKGLYVLFATEMWERFNYYGMRAILILFMTKALLFDKVLASQLYGSYTSLVYLTPLIGGFIADKYWGNKRSIITGGILMAIGEFILFFCATFYQSAPGISAFLFFTGLGFMITGNGFFKPNISSLVGQLYPKGDRRIDPAYTIFYMGINVGGALGPILCSAVGETGNPADFKWSFLIAGLGMALSVIIQKIYQDKYLIDPQGKELGNEQKNIPALLKNPILSSIGLVALAGIFIGMVYVDAKIFSFIFYLLIAALLLIAFLIFGDKTLSKIEKQRIVVIFSVAFFVVFFWSAFEQAGASLTFFTDEQTDRSLNLNVPVWVINLLSLGLLGLVASMWKKAIKNLRENDKSLLIGAQIVMGIIAIGLIYFNASFYLKGESSWSMNEIGAGAFQSLNSVFVVSLAPLFAWLWIKLGKYEPSSPTKMAIGLLLLSIGYFVIAIGVRNLQPGIKVSMLWITSLYFLHTCGELCLSPIGLSLVNKLAPLKYASLLMAVWFLANAFANKLAGVLSALYPENGKVTSFMGYKMENLYDFFLLFIVLSGVASLILFALTKTLQKLMHQDKE
jgi:proton-dependent oligopeptide transporter, POT family